MFHLSTGQVNHDCGARFELGMDSPNGIHRLNLRRPLRTWFIVPEDAFQVQKGIFNSLAPTEILTSELESTRIDSTCLAR